MRWRGRVRESMDNGRRGAGVGGGGILGSLARNIRWWIQDYLYAAYWQVRGLFGGRGPSDYLSGTRRPVLVLPGIYESWHFMRPLIERLDAAGHPVHVVAALRRNQRPVDVAARIVADYVDAAQLEDVVIVAHSKGGLIGKYLMMRHDADRRIRSMVAISTPFSGSRYALLMLLPSLRAFSPRGPMTTLLARDLRINARITSVFGEFDPHIPEGSVLTEGRNVKIATGGHFRILGDPAVVDLVLREAALSN